MDPARRRTRTATEEQHGLRSIPRFRRQRRRSGGTTVAVGRGACVMASDAEAVVLVVVGVGGSDVPASCGAAGVMFGDDE